jgi:hypothetical protein
MYEVRDGDGNSARTDDLALAAAIRELMYDRGARVVWIWNVRGERVAA